MPQTSVHDGGLVWAGKLFTPQMTILTYNIFHETQVRSDDEQQSVNQQSITSLHLHRDICCEKIQNSVMTHATTYTKVQDRLCTQYVC